MSCSSEKQKLPPSEQEPLKNEIVLGWSRKWETKEQGLARFPSRIVLASCGVPKEKQETRRRTEGNIEKERIKNKIVIGVI